MDSKGFAAATGRYLFIGCEILFREVCLLTATCRNHIDHRWITQGIHDLGSEKMKMRLQSEIDQVPEGMYDAILLGFALCNNGVVGISSPHTPIVIPRGHDCITLFLGARSQYDKIFHGNPGTYFLTPGWIERDEFNLEEAEGRIQEEMGLTMTREEMVEQYGEENADFLMAQMGDMVNNYTRIAYIDTGVDPDGLFALQARAKADEKGFDFLELKGDLVILEKLLAGSWDEDILVVPPGGSVEASNCPDIIRCMKC